MLCDAWSLRHGPHNLRALHLCGCSIPINTLKIAGTESDTASSTCSQHGFPITLYFFLRTKIWGWNHGSCDQDSKNDWLGQARHVGNSHFSTYFLQAHNVRCEKWLCRTKNNGVAQSLVLQIYSFAFAMCMPLETLLWVDLGINTLSSAGAIVSTDVNDVSPRLRASNRVSSKRLFNIHRCAAVNVVLVCPCDRERNVWGLCWLHELKEVFVLVFPPTFPGQKRSQELARWESPANFRAGSLSEASSECRSGLCLHHFASCQTKWKTQVPANCSLPLNLQHHRRWRTLSHPESPVIMSLDSHDPSTFWINSFCQIFFRSPLTSGSCFSSPSLIRSKDIVKLVQTKIQLRSCLQNLWLRINMWTWWTHLTVNLCSA